MEGKLRDRMWDHAISHSPAVSHPQQSFQWKRLASNYWLVGASVSVVLFLILIITQPPLVKRKGDAYESEKTSMLRLLFWSVLPGLVIALFPHAKSLIHHMRGR